MPEHDGISLTERATRLAIELFDCSWCTAKATQYCRVQPRGFDPVSLGCWWQTHLGRFPTGESPEEFLARQDANGETYYDNCPAG